MAAGPKAAYSAKPPGSGMRSRAKWYVLLEDPDVRRWHAYVAKGARCTSNNYLRALGRLLAPSRMTPRDVLAMAPRERDDWLDDFLDKEAAKGRAGSYIVVYKKALESWLDFNGQELTRTIRIRGRTHRPKASRYVIPNQEGLRSVLNVADARGRAAIALVGAGFRSPALVGEQKTRCGWRRSRSIPGLLAIDELEPVGVDGDDGEQVHAGAFATRPVPELHAGQALDGGLAGHLQSTSGGSKDSPMRSLYSRQDRRMGRQRSRLHSTHPGSADASSPVVVGGC